MWRYRPIAGLLVLAILAGGCGGSGPVPLLRRGDEAPSFSLPNLAGGELSSSALAGEPVVLNFWATWCQPCLRELPVLNEMVASPGVRVVAIALDEEGARVVQPFVEEHRLAYTILLGNQDVFRRFSGFAIPLTLVLDGSWTVVGVYRGPVTREDLAADLASIEQRTTSDES